MTSRPFNIVVRRAAVALLVTSLAAAAVVAAASAPAWAAPGTVTVTDDTGRHVVVPPPPQRLASLAPSATAMLFAAGAGSQVVAAAATEYSTDPAVRRIPRIGDANALDLERLVALRPTVIVAWPGGENPAELDRLRRLGIPIYRERVSTLAGLASSLRRLGMLAGTRASADRAADRLDARLAALTRRYAAARPVTVLLQVWSHPVYTVGGTHLLTDALRVCGARNVFGDLRQLGPAVSTEAVVARDPDIIIAVAPAQESERWLAEWRRFPEMRAVADGNLIPFGDQRLTRLGPGTLDATRELCVAIDAARHRLR